ncbi:MAG: glycoside hydrolase family 3 N-terminal domain-containing protein [Wujia sp.]
MGVRQKRLLYAIIIVCMLVVGIFGTVRDSQDDQRNFTNQPEQTEEPNRIPQEEGELGKSKHEEKTILDYKIEDAVSKLTVEELVGQMFFIKDDDRFGPEVLESCPAGGIILFANDFARETPDSLTKKIQAFQDASKTPLLIGTDEEGGPVIRVSRYGALVDHAYASPRQLFAQGGYDKITEDTIEKSQLLLSYGINVNFAPVCDVSVNSGDFMYLRSFGDSAKATAVYVERVVEIMKREKMGSVLKHFPGYGNNGDTHTNTIRDKREYGTFLESDYIPFQAGIAAGADCVLVSHNIVECLDADNPASISKKVHEELRKRLDFQGVIITDDLMMSGVANSLDVGECAVQAILAGNDMVLSTDYKMQYQAVLNAVTEGRITKEQLKESVQRIYKWKYNLGILKI